MYLPIIMTMQPGWFQRGMKREISRKLIFDTCKTRLIAPQKGQRLRTVGFMNEDLIYGMLNKEDILTDEEGHKSVGIRILRIEDFEGNVKKRIPERRTLYH